MAGPIRISILANAAQAKREMDSVAGSANTMGSKLGKFGKIAGTAVAGGLVVAAGAAVKFGTEAAKAAAEAQQNLGGAEAVFGKFADTIKNKGAGAYKTLGLSQSDYLSTANKMGSLFQGSGIKVKESVDLTSKAMRRAADVASVMGVDSSMAMESIAGAAKGNFTMMDNLGVSMNAASIEAYALSKGMNFKWTTATQAEKTRVAMKMFFEKTGKYAGNYEKESTKTLSGAMEALKAQGKNLMADVGMKLLPVLTSLAVTVSTKVLPAIERFGGWLQANVLPVVKQVGGQLQALLVPAFQALGQFLGPIIARVKEFFAGLSGGTGAMGPFASFIQGKLLPALQSIWMAFQGLVAVVVPIIRQVVAAFIANWSKIQPYVKQVFDSVKQIIVGVMGIVKQVITIVTKAIQVIWQNFGSIILKYVTSTFNNIAKFIGGVMKAISGVVKLVLAVLKGDWSGAWNAIKQIVSGVWQAIKAIVSQGVNIIKTVMSAAWKIVKAGVSAAWDGIKAVIRTNVELVMGIIRGLKDRIVGFFSGAIGWLKSAGQAIINGLIAGIDAAKQWLISKIQALADLIPDWLKKRLGIASPSKVTKKIGKFVGEGLAVGLVGARDDVKSALSGLSDLVKDQMDKMFVKAKSAAAATRASLAAIKDEASALRENGKAREALGAALDAARTKLQEVTQASRDYAASIRESIVATGEFASMKFVDEEGNAVTPTADAIIQQLRDRVAAAERFSAVVQQISAMGLNEQSVNNILKSGVESGLPIAEAVLAGGATAVSEINMLTTKLADTGTVLGEKMSDKYFSAGISAAASVVKGLESQAERLRARARKLAAEIAAELQSAFDAAAGAAKTEAAAEKAKVAEKKRPKPKAGGDDGKAGKNYTINVKAPVGSSSADIGRTITKHIDAYEQAGGRRRS